MADYYLETMTPLNLRGAAATATAATELPPWIIQYMFFQLIFISVALLAACTCASTADEEDRQVLRTITNRIEALEAKADALPPFEMEVKSHTPGGRRPAASIYLRSSHRYLVQDQ